MSDVLRVTVVLIVIGYVLSLGVFWFAGMHSFPAMLACDFLPWFAVRRGNWKPA